MDKKPQLHLSKCDPQSLAKLYQNLTGKTPTPAEMARAQKVLAAAKLAVTGCAAPVAMAPSPKPSPATLQAFQRASPSTRQKALAIVRHLSLNSKPKKDSSPGCSCVAKPGALPPTASAQATSAPLPTVDATASPSQALIGPPT